MNDAPNYAVPFRSLIGRAGTRHGRERVRVILCKFLLDIHWQWLRHVSCCLPEFWVSIHDPLASLVSVCFSVVESVYSQCLTFTSNSNGSRREFENVCFRAWLRQSMDRIFARRGFPGHRRSSDCGRQHYSGRKVCSEPLNP